MGDKRHMTRSLNGLNTTRQIALGYEGRNEIVCPYADEQCGTNLLANFILVVTMLRLSSDHTHIDAQISDHVGGGHTNDA